MLFREGHQQRLPRPQFAVQAGSASAGRDNGHINLADLQKANQILRYILHRTHGDLRILPLKISQQRAEDVRRDGGNDARRHRAADHIDAFLDAAPGICQVVENFSRKRQKARARRGWCYPASQAIEEALADLLLQFLNLLTERGLSHPHALGRA